MTRLFLLSAFLCISVAASGGAHAQKKDCSKLSPAEMRLIDDAEAVCQKAKRPKEKVQSPVERFRSASQFESLKCDLQSKISLQQFGFDNYPSVYRDVLQCVTDAKAAVKPVFAAANASIPKKDPRNALKSYYGAWLSLMDSYVPRADDSVSDYKNRIAGASVKLSDEWNRYEAENVVN